MKNFKRVLSLALSFIMIFSVCIIGAGAAEAADYKIVSPYADVIWSGDNAWGAYRGNLHSHTTYSDADIDLAAITREHPNIRYGGVLLNHQVVEKEMEATLLVNPRPTVEEFVQYSFPSKNMEYMASGTPLLTTRLPGMPAEYYPYVYLLEEESPQGIADALRQILSHSEEDLHRKGTAARDFILGTRNNVAQGQKILTMLEQHSD